MIINYLSHKQKVRDKSRRNRVFPEEVLVKIQILQNISKNGDSKRLKVLSLQ